MNFGSKSIRRAQVWSPEIQRTIATNWQVLPVDVKASRHLSCYPFLRSVILLSKSYPITFYYIRIDSSEWNAAIAACSQVVMSMRACAKQFAIEQPIAVVSTTVIDSQPHFDSATSSTSSSSSRGLLASCLVAVAATITFAVLSRSRRFWVHRSRFVLLRWCCFGCSQVRRQSVCHLERQCVGIQLISHTTTYGKKKS